MISSHTRKYVPLNPGRLLNFVSDSSNTALNYILSISMSPSVMDGHMSRVFSLCYLPKDPNIMVSAGWDDTVQVFP